MKLLISKRRWAIAALILLALFLIRPGASRLKSRIIYSISAALGRPVDIGAVHILLLPRPGFDLDNLVVYDDPAFGAEPMLRASSVTAALRLTSLIRGRLEIARMELTEPSLNLVHGESGRWNVESLVERTARIPLAPTAKSKAEPRPAFPYIEGSSGRINFKNGAEKRPYALTNADFSLWQESENTWGVRLKAQPFRSDMNLNDTGILQVTGTWQRAGVMRDTPLQIGFEWSRAQVGQLTKFITGSDQGWRGTVLLDLAFAGTPAELQISGNASLDDFRRYDITSGQALRMAAFCSAQYSSVTHDFRQVMCNAPVGKGNVTLTGNMGWPGSQRYSLAVEAANVPANALVVLAQRLKKDLPDDLAAEGTLHGTLSLRADGRTAPRWQGRGEISQFLLNSASNKVGIGPETLPFGVASVTPHTKTAQKQQSPSGTHLEIGSFSLGSGRSATPNARGWVSRAGYSFAVTGDSEIGRMLRLGRILGIPTTASTVEGSAKLDLTLAGAWRGQGGEASFTGPQLLGSARLHNVQIALRASATPVEIVSADTRLLNDSVHVQHLNAKGAGASWTGSLQLPRGCVGTARCPAHFALKTNQLTFDEVDDWVHPRPKKRPWYKVLEPDSESRGSVFASLRATGQISVDRFQLRKVAASRVSADVDLDDGKLLITDLSADLLSGHLQGEWKLDFGAKPPKCGGSGKISSLSLADLATAMNDDWMSGTATANYEIESTCSADFWQSAQATVDVEAKNGTLPHLLFGDDQQPMRIKALSGQARLHGGKIEIKDGRLASPDGIYQLNGTASFGREIDLKLTRSANAPSAGYTITGTLSEPQVAPLAAMQARLKSLPSK